MARNFSIPSQNLTRDIATLWYRPPELMLGDDKYLISADIWSVGCIMAEMINKKPLFTGTSQISQLYAIWKVLGTPNEENSPGVSKLPDFQPKFPKWKGE